MGHLLGYLGIVVHLALGLFCLGLGLVGLLDGGDMDIDLLPFAPESTSKVLVGSGLFALIAVFTAFGKSRFARSLLAVWSLAVAGILIAAFFRGSYRFDGVEGFWMHAAYLGVSLLALLGSWLRRRPPRRGRGYSAVSAKAGRRL